jgi:predicted cobalt transporter CbtA
VIEEAAQPELGGMPDNPHDPGADRLPNRAYWWRGTGSPERALWRELMLLRRRMAALFVVLALAGCAQPTTGETGAPYAPYSPENNGNMHDSGGDGGGTGGM